MTPRELVLVGLIVACLGVMAYLGHRIDAMSKSIYQPMPESTLPVHQVRELLEMQHRHALELAKTMTNSAPEDPRDAVRRLMTGNYPGAYLGAPTIEPAATITPLSEPLEDGSDITDWTLPHPALFTTPGQHVPQPDDDVDFKYPPVGMTHMPSDPTAVA
jgi:hypothetical protein